MGKVGETGPTMGHRGEILGDDGQYRRTSRCVLEGIAIERSEGLRVEQLTSRNRANQRLLPRATASGEMVECAGLDPVGLDVGLGIAPLEPNHPADLVRGELPGVHKAVDRVLIETERCGCLLGTQPVALHSEMLRRHRPTRCPHHLLQALVVEHALLDFILGQLRR